MNSNHKLSYAIAAILSGSSLGMSLAHAGAAADVATDAGDSDAIQEITVTAQRRTESIQDVPITIQAFTGDQLKQLNVQTFDDLIKYTPNVTFNNNGPGQGNIFMRGLSSGSAGNQSTATIAPFPNVALFLDDQSMQFPARNLDVYAVDMERVEVLEGPQGTLFGGSAEAGAIRYITNKPKLNVAEGNVDVSYGTTAGGDPNSSANATINIPLIEDHLAIRATIFDDHRGGYISNVPGTITQPIANQPTANNSALVGSNENPLTYTGFRLSALYQFNDDWNLLVQQNYQNMEADGYFDEYPYSNSGQALGADQITAFEPAYDKDRYESTSWTINGKIDDWKLVYTGSYMIRHIEQQQDYSNYLLSGGGQYYSCTGKGASITPGSTKPEICYAPTGYWNDRVANQHQSHEIRVASPDQYFVRGTAGAYWEKFQIEDQMNFDYLDIPTCTPQNLAIADAGGADCVQTTGPIPGTTAGNPTLRGPSTAFGEDTQRGYTQTAFFASADVDLLPKVLTFTAGTRLFHYSEYETGSEFYTSTASVDKPNGTAPNGFGINLHQKETGSRSRANLTWHVTPDTMAYYTFSQGFRPGGFNRTASTANGTVTLAGEAPYIAGDKATDQYSKPAAYGSDNLINNEIGVKSEFLDHRIQVNASIYRMKWENVQLNLFDPVNLGNTSFAVNGPTYVIKGAELQLVARATEGLTVQGSASWNSTNQTVAPCLVSNRATATNPTPLGDCITQVKGNPYTNPYGELDTSPAFSPPMQFNLRARYDWSLSDYKYFATVGANHVDSMRNEPASFPTGTSSYCSPIPTTVLCQYTMPGYTTYDAGLGVNKDAWTVQLIGNNLTNSDASTYTTSAQFIKSEAPLRPRVLTLRFGWKF